MTKLEFIDKINDILVGLNTLESDLLGSLYDEITTPAWVSVEDELPKHKVEDNGLITYEEVLVCLNDGYVTTDCYDDTRKKWLGYNGDVEYWMPLPTPPAKKGGQDGSNND